ncbi:MAG: hypothetical protein MJ102_01855 [Clostridia bacterium]|nr:hypothetical protein [Clostridia bacterium]
MSFIFAKNLSVIFFIIHWKRGVSGQRQIKNKTPSSSKIRTEHTLRGTTRNSGVRANTHKTDNGVTGSDYTAARKTAFTGSAPKGKAGDWRTVARSQGDLSDVRGKALLTSSQHLS